MRVFSTAVFVCVAGLSLSLSLYSCGFFAVVAFYHVVRYTQGKPRAVVANERLRRIVKTETIVGRRGNNCAPKRNIGHNCDRNKDSKSRHSIDRLCEFPVAA